MAIKLSSITGAWNIGKSMPLMAVCIALGLVIGFGGKGCGGGVGSRQSIVDSTKLAVLFDSVFKVLQEANRPAVFVTNLSSGSVIDSLVDCWGSLPPTLLGGRDTLSIDSVNSCKGLYRGMRFGKAACIDSSQYALIRILRDSLAAMTNRLLKNQNAGILNRKLDSLGNPFGGDRAVLGYEFEALFGTSIPGNMMAGATGRAWLGRYGIFATLRGVMPEFEKSTIDLGLSYKF